MKDRLSLGDEDLVGMVSLKEIVGGFIHEIAQPLNAIMIASQVIQMKLQRGHAPEEEKAYSIDRLKMIGSQVQRAKEILDSLRGFARGSSQPPRFGDLGAWVQTVKGLMAQQFTSRGIELTLEEPGQSFPVGVDPNTVQGSVVMALAFVRDKCQLIGEWHAANNLKYKKAIKIRLVHVKGLSSVQITWNSGDLPANHDIPEPPSLVGLRAARAVLASAGGTLERRATGLLIGFPGN